jgi:hypothetical protein
MSKTQYNPPFVAKVAVLVIILAIGFALKKKDSTSAQQPVVAKQATLSQAF